MKNKVLLIGGVGVGKTTLKQKLLGQIISYRKTQVLEFSSLFIDCPGEYLEIPKYYHVLIDTSRQAMEVWALQDATGLRCIFPPNFAQIFSKPTIGIITKIDKEKASLERARNFLCQGGFKEPIYSISAQNGAGIAELASRLV